MLFNLFCFPPTLKLLMLNCIFPPTFGEAQPAPTRDRIDVPAQKKTNKITKFMINAFL